MRPFAMLLAVVTAGLVRADEPPQPLPPPAQPGEPVVTIAEDDDDKKAHRGPLGPHWGPDEYLLWWITPQQVPDLLIAGSGTNPLIGEPGVRTLIGGSLVAQAHSGGRFVWGWSVDKEQTIGVEFGYFFLGSRSRTLAAESDGGPGSPTLSRPFLAPDTLLPTSEIIAAPGLLAGGFELVASSRVQGGEVNAVSHLFAGCNVMIDGLVGFRFLQVHEGLRIAARQSFAGDNFYSITDTVDQIDGHNRFYGGQIGLRMDWRHGRAFLDLSGKVAFGQTNEVVTINGLTVVTSSAAGDSVTPTGFYAGPNNSGRFTNSVFAVVPEATVRVGWLRNESRWFVGYNFLALSRLARPGDQIDPVLGHRTVWAGGPPPGALDRPAHEFRQASFWAQGLMIGAEVRY